MVARELHHSRRCFSDFASPATGSRVVHHHLSSNHPLFYFLNEIIRYLFIPFPQLHLERTWLGGAHRFKNLIWVSKLWHILFLFFKANLLLTTKVWRLYQIYTFISSLCNVSIDQNTRVPVLFHNLTKFKKWIRLYTLLFSYFLLP